MNPSRKRKISEIIEKNLNEKEAKKRKLNEEEKKSVEEVKVLSTDKLVDSPIKSSD